MSKPDSGHFSGTKGEKISGNSSIPPLFNNGHVTPESVATHREEFMGKSVEQIADLLTKNGYEFIVHGSKNEKSTATILEINNASKERNIKQVQVSPNGSKRHGNVPYVKISTSNEGKIKIINGTKEQYTTDGNEKAKLIFRRDNND